MTRFSFGASDASQTWYLPSHGPQALVPPVVFSLARPANQVVVVQFASTLLSFWAVGVFTHWSLLLRTAVTDVSKTMKNGIPCSHLFSTVQVILSGAKS